MTRKFKVGDRVCFIPGKRTKYHYPQYGVVYTVSGYDERPGLEGHIKFKELEEDHPGSAYNEDMFRFANSELLKKRLGLT